MNKSLLIGRVASDVETSAVNDRLLANFTLVESHKGKSNFIRIVAWGEAAKIATRLKKGDPTFIEGRIQCRRDNTVEIVAWTILKVDDEWVRGFREESGD